MISTTNPAIVSQTAVRRLPRLALLLLCTAYVLPGFVGRDLWKNADVSAFGVMLEMAAGRSDWWLPQVLGAPAEATSLLPYWLGALFIRLLPFLPAEVAARIPFAGLLALTLACTWYTVYQLARQPSAQPVAFAFGGEAQPTDYARSLADAGLLALLACLGLAQMSHETTPDLARLSMVSVLLLGAARLAHADDKHRWTSILIWSCGALGLALSGAPWVSLFMGTSLLLAAWQPGMPPEPQRHPLLPSAAATLGLAAVAGLLTRMFSLPELDSSTSLAEVRSWGRLLVWFTWPAWPLVLWTLWGWRRRLRSPHVSLPLCVVVVSITHSAISPESDRALLLSLPGMAALASFALPTLRRGVSALIDWFTLIFFTVCALAIWVIWLAVQTGVPAKPAANVARLAPGFVAEFSPLLFLLGMLVSAAWVWLVVWRVGRNRQAIWKTLVLPAAGTTLCWMLLLTLWLPLLDFGRSYGPLSRAIARLVADHECTLVDGLSQAQIVALQYQGGLTLVRTRPDGVSGAACASMVVSPETERTLYRRVRLTDWAYKASVSRLNDTKERLLVYVRVSAEERSLSPATAAERAPVAQ